MIKTQVGSVHEALRELKESGECIVHDEMLFHMICEHLTEIDIKHDFYQKSDHWVVEQY
jgi:hypothetical protein